MPGGFIFIPRFIIQPGYLVDNSGNILNYTDLSPADTNCTYGIHWIYTVMGQCAMDSRGLAAVSCGFICIIAWILNGVPQMIENFRKGIPDQAVSPFLLLFWTLGDVCNLVGCILAHQLVLQAVISVYSIASDLVLSGQFLYYRLRHKTALNVIANTLRDGEITPVDSSSDSGEPSTIVHTNLPIPDLHRIVPVCFIGMFGFALWIFHDALNTSADIVPLSLSRSNVYVARRLLEAGNISDPTHQLEAKSMATAGIAAHPEFLDTTAAKIGYVLGCFSSFLYLNSRFPQIFRNWRRGSTEGVSLGFFCFVLLGNTSYGLQIFLTSTESLYLLRAIPWIIGSLGVFVLDIVILYQFYYYKRQPTSLYALLENAHEEHEAQLSIHS